jgi:hypothetical protein
MKGNFIVFQRTGPNRMNNEQGVCVEILGRTGIRYTEAGRSVDVDSEVLSTPEIGIFAASIRNWNDGTPIDETGRSRIIEKIREAVRSQGEDIVVI